MQSSLWSTQSETFWHSSQTFLWHLNPFLKHNVIEIMKAFSKPKQSLYSELFTVLKLLRIMPASNAVSESLRDLSAPSDCLRLTWGTECPRKDWITFWFCQSIPSKLITWILRQLLQSSLQQSLRGAGTLKSSVHILYLNWFCSFSIVVFFISTVFCSLCSCFLYELFLFILHSSLCLSASELFITLINSLLVSTSI